MSSNHGGICSDRSLRPRIRINRTSSSSYDCRNTADSRIALSLDGDNLPEDLKLIRDPEV